MSVVRDGSARDDLATLFGAGAVGRLGDAELLERFASGRGDAAARAAFATLVERHGPMVRAVCRRALGDGHAADDAFQATFLVLARRAGAVRVDDSLGRWLYGVSVRVAMRAKARARVEGRRTWALDGLDPPDRAAEADPVLLGELRAALDEEIARLPPRYRSALVLCDVEGLSQPQAARRLRCPLGTVQSRLHRARERLRSRLARRGLAPSAGLTAALGPEAARTAIPAALADAATLAAVRLATPSAPGTVPAAVLTLAAEVSRAMVLSKLKAVVAPLLAAGVVISGVALAALEAGEAPDAAPPIVQERGSDAGDGPEALRSPRTPAEEEGARDALQGPGSLGPVDLTGDWEVVYLSGTPRDTRKGFVRPNWMVPITPESIKLPFLTGGSLVPIYDRGPLRYVLDPDGRPGEIDFVDSAGSGGPKTLRGIYQLKGDLLAICYGAPDGDRPRTFADKASEHLLILVDRTSRILTEPSPEPAADPARSASRSRSGAGVTTVEVAGRTAGDAPPLTNAGVEEGAGKSPEGWSRGAAVPGVEYLWDRTTAHDGKASLRLKKTADRYFPIAQWSQEIPREGDAPRLKVSAWIKADQAAKAILDVQFLDGDGEWSHAWASYIGAKAADDPPVTHDWKRYEGVVSIPPGTRRLIIAPQIYGPGTVWFDDLRAEYTTEPETDPTGSP